MASTARPRKTLGVKRRRVAPPQVAKRAQAEASNHHHTTNEHQDNGDSHDHASAHNNGVTTNTVAHSNGANGVAEDDTSTDSAATDSDNEIANTKTADDDTDTDSDADNAVSLQRPTASSRGGALPRQFCHRCAVRLVISKLLFCANNHSTGKQKFTQYWCFPCVEAVGHVAAEELDADGWICFACKGTCDCQRCQKTGDESVVKAEIVFNDRKRRAPRINPAGQSPKRAAAAKPKERSSKSRADSERRRIRREADSDRSGAFRSNAVIATNSNRTLRAKRLINYATPLIEDPFSFIECTWYKQRSDQPFTVLLDRPVIVMLDIHSHLADTEVIGLLSGEWSEENRTLTVRGAYPCRTVRDELTHVEMDAESQVAVSCDISERGQSVIGWYHSHPHFINQPSIIDVDNQQKYQSLFAMTADTAHATPFIGAIVTPYGCDNFRPTHSDIKWFFTSHIDDSITDGPFAQSSAHSRGISEFDGISHVPMELWTDVIDVVHTHNDARLSHRLRADSDETLSRAALLVREYADVKSRVDFESEWTTNQHKHPQHNHKTISASSSSRRRPLMSSCPTTQTTSPYPSDQIRSKLSHLEHSLFQSLTNAFSRDEKVQRIQALVNVIYEWKRSPRDNDMRDEDDDDEANDAAGDAAHADLSPSTDYEL